MVHDTNRFFVLTGGPGAGKSTLIEALARLGYSHTVEAGRGIIQDQADIGGLALPWADRALFAEMMLAWERRSYRVAQQHPGPVFFDRGVPDVIGYLRLVGEPVPQHAVRAAEEFRYNRRVFIAPPWKEIFHPDRERKQDFDEAVRTYDALVSAYRDYGYELLELPRGSVGERVQFVLGAIRDAGFRSDVLR